MLQAASDPGRPLYQGASILAVLQGWGLVSLDLGGRAQAPREFGQPHSMSSPTPIMGTLYEVQCSDGALLKSPCHSSLVTAQCPLCQ